LSRNINIKKRGQNVNRAGQETRALREHVPDQALLFTGQAPIKTGMPPLISYISRHSRGIGESNRQLERQVMFRTSLASTISRAMHLPVLSKAFDFIRRTNAFFTPIYQRMLELPWLRLRSKADSSSIQINSAIADGQRHNISLQPNKFYPNMLLQSSSDTEEEQVGDKADQTYSRPTEETYSMITSPLLSTLPTRRDQAITAYDLPHTASPETMPRHTREIMAQRNQNVQARTSHLDATKQSVSRASEAPAVQKHGLSSLVAGMGLPDTNSEAPQNARPIHMALRKKQITHGPESEDGDEPISFQAIQSNTTVPAIYTTYEVREPDLAQAKVIGGKHTEVYRQSYNKYRTIGLSPILMPITQRITSQRKSMKTGSRIIGQGIGETRSSSIFHTETSDEPTGQAGHISHSLVLLEQPETLELKSVLQAYPPWSGSAISKGKLDRPSLSKEPMITKNPSEMASSTRLNVKLTDRVNAEMLPDRIAHQSLQKTRQAQWQKPLVTSHVELPGDRRNAIYQTELMVGDNQGKDGYYPSTKERGIEGLSLTREQIIKPQFGSQPLSIAGSATQLSPAYESIHHAMNLATQRFTNSIYQNGLSNKIENYRFAPGRGYMSVLPDKKYACQQAPEPALTSSFQEKSGSNTVYRKEMLTGASDIFNDPTYSTKRSVPELTLAPMNRVPEILTLPFESEPQEAGSNERVDKDDLENIARDVYHILKRRLSRERERALGVI